MPINLRTEPVGKFEKALQETVTLNQPPPIPLPLPANSVPRPTAYVLCAIFLYQMLTK